MSDYTLKVVIDAVSDKFDATIKRAEAALQGLKGKYDGIAGSLDKVGTKCEAMGKSLTTKVTAPLVAAGTVGVKKFAEVDKTMALTNATMGNSAQQAEMLNEAMKAAAAQSVFGMNDAAGATLNFARAGLTAEEAASALAPAMNLAAGEGGNLDTVSAGLTATINGFGDSFQNTAQYADVFANACNNSALDVNSLSGAMSIAAPIFHAAGYSVNDAALYMGVMANNGIEASVAANSLKTGMARLIEPSKQGAQWMEKLGISVTNADGTMKDSVQVQKELHDAFAGLSESEQIAAASAIFGKNQMSNWLALINTAPDEVAKLNGQISEQGTVTKMAQAMMSGFGGSIEQLKSGIDVAATSLGEALAPSLQKVISGLQTAVDWFNALTPAQQQLVAKIGMIVAAIGPVLLVGGKVMQMTSSIMTLAKSGEGVFGKLFSLPPSALLIVAVIGLIIAALVHLYNTNEEFRAAVQSTWAQIKEAMVPVVEALKAAFASLKPALDSIIAAISSAMQVILPIIAEVATVILGVLAKVIPVIAAFIASVVERAKFVLQVVISIIQSMVAGIKGAIDIVKGIIEVLRAIFMTVGQAIITVWQNVKSFTIGIWTAIKSKVQNTFNALKVIAQAIIGPIKTVFTTIATHISNVFTRVRNAWKGLKDFAGGIANGIAGAFKRMVSKVKGIINKFIGAANVGIGVVNKLPGVSISKIPYLAHGTKNWAGGFAMMNEGGRGELTYLPNGAQVIPHDVSVKYAKEAARYNAADDSRMYSAMAGLANAMMAGAQMQSTGGGEYHFTIELGGTRVAEQIYKLNKQGELILKGA